MLRRPLVDELVWRSSHKPRYGTSGALTGSTRLITDERYVIKSKSGRGARLAGGHWRARLSYAPCKATRNVTASEAFEAAVKIAFLSAFITANQVEILRMIGARLVGNANFGAQERCAELATSSSIA